MRPFFLDSPDHRLFCQWFGPAAAEAERVWVYLPPFAEEANRCRRMAVLQARALAASGHAVVLLDYFGTGDSAGEFAGADIAIWRRDVACLCDHLAARGVREIGLWGLRFGALLAAAAAAELSHPLGDLLLWQPAGNGKTLLAQFLRIRLAATMGSQAAETAAEMRAALRQGKTLEVAGYELNGRLAEGLEELALAGLVPPAATKVHWLELARAPGAEVSPGSQRVIDAWRQHGCAIDAATVAGERFWELPEITLAPALIDATTAIFEGKP